MSQSLPYFTQPVVPKTLTTDMLNNFRVRCRKNVHSYERTSSATGPTGSLTPEPAFIAAARCGACG